MNKKVYKTLEFHKILEQLEGYAFSEEAKKRCRELEPLTDPDEISQLQQTTADALSRIYRHSSLQEYIMYMLH